MLKSKSELFNIRKIQDFGHEISANVCGIESWGGINMEFLSEQQIAIEELIEEREEIKELIESLPIFKPRKDWHLSEQHTLYQCLIEVEKELQELHD